MDLIEEEQAELIIKKPKVNKIPSKQYKFLQKSQNQIQDFSILAFQEQLSACSQQNQCKSIQGSENKIINSESLYLDSKKYQIFNKYYRKTSSPFSKKYIPYQMQDEQCSNEKSLSSQDQNKYKLSESNSKDQPRQQLYKYDTNILEQKIKEQDNEKDAVESLSQDQIVKNNNF